MRARTFPTEVSVIRVITATVALSVMTPTATPAATPGRSTPGPGVVTPALVLQTHQRVAEQVLPHPAGCPKRRFCGCGAAVDLLGAPVRGLWRAAAWFGFPRAAPAPNTVAVQRHHVMVLKQHVAGSQWLVADYNSGGGRSRLHVRSISGFTIVDPRG